MNRKQLTLAAALGVPLLSGGMANALAQEDFFVVPLTGFQEVLPVQTAGNEPFVVANSTPVTYELNLTWKETLFGPISIPVNPG